MKAAKPKPARIAKVIGAHRLTGVRYETGWVFTCTFADLAAKYAGVTDASECIEAFEMRATGQAGEPQKASA